MSMTRAQFRGPAIHPRLDELENLRTALQSSHGGLKAGQLARFRPNLGRNSPCGISRYLPRNFCSSAQVAQLASCVFLLRGNKLGIKFCSQAHEFPIAQDKPIRMKLN